MINAEAQQFHRKYRGLSRHAKKRLGSIIGYYANGDYMFENGSFSISEMVLKINWTYNKQHLTWTGLHWFYDKSAICTKTPDQARMTETPEPMGKVIACGPDIEIYELGVIFYGFNIMYIRMTNGTLYSRVNTQDWFKTEFKQTIEDPEYII